jgi:hypothetical protein
LLQAARQELERLRQLQPSFRDTGGFAGAAEWQSYTGIMRPLADKPPWLAAWDRAVRILVRLEQRTLADSERPTKSPAEELFATAADGRGALAQPEFEQVRDVRAADVWALQLSRPLQQCCVCSESHTHFCAHDQRMLADSVRPCGRWRRSSVPWWGWQAALA